MNQILFKFYCRWLPLYCEDWMKLKTTFPISHETFSRGDFVVHHSWMTLRWLGANGPSFREIIQQAIQRSRRIDRNHKKEKKRCQRESFEAQEE